VKNTNQACVKYLKYEGTANTSEAEFESTLVIGEMCLKNEYYTFLTLVY